MLLQNDLLLAEALFTSADVKNNDAVLMQLVELMDINDGYRYTRAAIDKELQLFRRTSYLMLPSFAVSNASGREPAFSIPRQLLCDSFDLCHHEIPRHLVP